MSNERDLAFAELTAAKVIEPAGFNDGNGNPAFRLLGFPSGERGRKLQALFDQHVKGRVSC
jgi:hypothetical protein